jgi:signal transduction histidine kinase
MPPVPIGLKFSYKEKAEWKEKFLRNEYINGPFDKLAPEDQDFLKVYDIKSIVIIPIFLQDHFWGFFSIDDCKRERTFTEEEIDILHSASLMMASAINRHIMFAERLKAEDDLRLARDAAEAASHAKSSFLANMSHEIRTPMNSIIGFTELAMDDDIPLMTRDYLNKINETSEWLLHIISDILDISKIESGK